MTFIPTILRFSDLYSLSMIRLGLKSRRNLSPRISNQELLVRVQIHVARDFVERPVLNANARTVV